MATPLLQTKLYIPPPRPDPSTGLRTRLVPRPRLIERLNAGLRPGCKLTLISAPAGFGKTTLLSEWVHHMPQPVAWLSLDEGDNDLARLLAYLVAALQTVEGNVGQGVLAALQSPEAVNVEAVLTTLINEIAGLPSDPILVLDDYHVIESQAVDKALTFFLDHLPPRMHLVIATRTDPTLPLSRLRARGQLTELRETDLRFTTDEAAVFLKQVVRLPISSDDVRTLEKRTEGWITGLQLAAVAMQVLGQRDQIAHFIHSFSGSHRYVIDYLVDEVLDQQTPRVQAFLLQTSILDRLVAPLCNAVAGREDSQAILEQLEAANLFLIPLDDERRWYRYHHLFADLLIHRLRRTWPDRLPELYRQASIWYKNEGYIDDAFRYAQAAGDTERAADILENHWQGVFLQGELTKLKSLLDSLDPEYTKNSAPLRMAYCMVYSLTGAIDLIPSHIKNIRRILKDGAEKDVLQPIKLAVIPSLVETMEAIVFLDNKQARKAKEHARKAISLIPDDPNPATRRMLYGAASFRLGQAHRELGEFDQACSVLLEVLEMLKARENYYVVTTVLQIVSMYQESGKTQEAITLCEDTIGYIQEHHMEQITPSGLVYVILAGLQADSGDFEKAKKNLEIGQELGERMKLQSVLDLADSVKEKLGTITPPPQPLVEPLSQRELEILQLVAHGLSNREIGEQLTLALSTVKGHNQNIYGKLQVHRRTEAIARARELGLL